MADAKPESMCMAGMHQRTIALIALAKEAGDEFLQYLYKIALMHIEEKARIVPDDQRNGPDRAVDPAIKELAAKLLNMRRCTE